MTTTQELLESSFELNLNNYGPEDVERLNDWAIKAYAALEALQAEVVRLRVIAKEAAEYATKHQTEVLRLQAQLAAAQGQDLLEVMCARIKAADDAMADGNYMLDSDDCISVIRGTWKPPMLNDKPAAPIPQPPAPSEAAREYMTGYSDGKEWAGATSQAGELNDAKRLDWIRDQLFEHKWNGVVGKGCAVQWVVAPDFRFKQRELTDDSGIAAGDFRRAIDAAIKQGGQQ